MYQCFHCNSKSVVWQSDYSFEDMGIVYELEDGKTTEEGIVHICHCSNCGAEIEYKIPIAEEELL